MPDRTWPNYDRQVELWGPKGITSLKPDANLTPVHPESNAYKTAVFEITKLLKAPTATNPVERPVRGIEPIDDLKFWTEGNHGKRRSTEIVTLVVPATETQVSTRFKRVGIRPPILVPDFSSETLQTVAGQVVQEFHARGFTEVDLYQAE